MNSSNLVSTVAGVILRVACTVLVVFLIYRGATICYDYGYRTFAEPPVSSGEGRIVTVNVTEGMSPSEMGELFLKKGLIRDSKLFVLQYYFSEFRKDIQPGIFQLSTAMTVEEMMEVMATPPTEEEP